ncbi:NDP-sugar epimerase, includes UDP-GlcNAc-inverting 4,6-dehydratase FlaA1 and capsular polysaccharide biosynthesis protein EpsC [Aquimarina amphilecti]|uniref:NDP-sugar epimerase, includes UDP-GlcNAc-inverting 4,6-dehydratase FlaA1 and capsular polysaccharide biosynthesis protein EpsC n=1 Tax=Aquimarina amphilecti TaxID=1038014 RepID=A0A1H7HSW1_AQUAM|nr:nucleoside-diphosphate sugar epimerase/dehydratase [Aquimarina amphilecti]SEK52632.1 NDP-sugar epimerase, includes UDP-GlcNAc-inverting 4,6-dehydratase FlaA1 and capsular polysaccharide biosynthesis protein EpsC [Aquimarina amphilecti]
MIKDYIINNSHKHASKWLVLSIDIAITIFNFFLAYVVRFGITFDFDLTNFIYQVPVMTALAGISFLLIGSYKGVVRHTGMRDAYNLFLAVTILIALSGALMVSSRLSLMPELLNIPVSIICVHYLLNIITLTTSRLIFKYCYLYVKSKLGDSSRVMIYGAGDSGLITLAAITNDSHKSVTVVGFIDDNPQKVGKTINGIKVYRSEAITQNYITKHNITEIVVSIPHIDKLRLSKISDNLLKLPVKVKIIPAINDWIDGKLNVSQIKQIQIEDLLDRAPIALENQNIKRELDNKVILITGAAGSIGSEIVRQASFYTYKHLVLVDQAESPLYDLQQELLSKGVTNFTPIVADIRDHQRIETIFDRFKPNMVFHAAAYKHVPLMENNPCEAIKINVLGTRKLADLSCEYGVDKFVFVSTDKAVNPTNVMGATKRVAEMYIKCLHRTSKTKFITTRFGNVLGSNGSVIPLFKKQIDKGGPLTVTHKDVTRFFMTIPEASQLVIEAGTMGNGGEIFIFDMGESVKIFDLAKKMIRLSGLNYPNDIDIEITGLRPGEKLYEELLADTENTLPTYHKKIMISKHDNDDCLLVMDKIDDLCIMNLFNQDHKIVGKLKEIVPEFISKNSTFESIDIKNNEIDNKEQKVLV